MHKRVHFNRYEGQRMQDNSALVTRQTRYGEFGREEALRLYKIYLDWAIKWKLLDLAPLAGKDLACNCQLNEACHADILLARINELKTKCNE